MNRAASTGSLAALPRSTREALRKDLPLGAPRLPGAGMRPLSSGGGRTPGSPSGRGANRSPKANSPLSFHNDDMMPASPGNLSSSNSGPFRARGGLTPQMLSNLDDFQMGPVSPIMARNISGLSAQARQQPLQLDMNDFGSCSSPPLSPMSRLSTSASFAGCEAVAVAGSSTSSCEAVSSPSRPWQVGTRLCPLAAMTDLKESSETHGEHIGLLARRRRTEPMVVDTANASPRRATFKRSQTTGRLQDLRPKFDRDIRVLGSDETTSGKTIFDLFHWDEVLQEEGDGGKVVVCQHKMNGRPCGPKLVMKMRSKASLTEQETEEQFRRTQLRILNLPPHAGVMPVTEVLEDDKFYYIVMEKASGGSFFSSLIDEFQDGVMPTAAVQRLMRDILESVGHVHRQGILHRDVKPDNLVVQIVGDPDSPGDTRQRVALIDFDHADPDWDPSTPSCQGAFHGTLRFSAPETFMGFFSQASDLYSVGVILYMLMSGKMPFEDDIYAEDALRKKKASWARNHWRGGVYKRLQEARVDWQCDPWPAQLICREFCEQLLAFEPTGRFASAEEALQHRWLDEDHAAEV